MEGGTGDTFFDKYDLGEAIGKGNNLIVKTCSSRQTGQVCAVKIINLSKFGSKQQNLIKNLKREEGISNELKHNLVVPVLEAYYNDSFYYMIYDYMEGADLCQEIANRALSGFVYSEAVASHYMKQILEAIRYIHSKNIIHRDIKLHSISLSSRENSSPVKLGGFSSAVTVEELENTQEYALDDETRCLSQVLISKEKDRFGYLSSPDFLAPEMLSNQYYGKPVDVWAAGCLLYLILCGSPPFPGSPGHRKRATLSSFYILDSKQWKEISEEAKSLIRKMLEPTPSRRITIDDALKEPWIKDRSRVPKLHLGETVRTMQKFNEFRAIKDLVISTALDSCWSKQAYCSSPALSSLSNRGDSELGGVQVILECLEDLQALENCDNTPEGIFEPLTSDYRFNSYLHLFENIQMRILTLKTNYQQETLTQQLSEVLDHLSNRYRNSVEEVRAFCDLVISPHFQALLQSHDLVASRLNTNTALRLADCHDQSGTSMLAVNGNFREGTISRQTLTPQQQQQQNYPGSQSTFKSSTLTFQNNNNSYGFNNNNNNNNKVSPGGSGLGSVRNDVVGVVEDNDPSDSLPRVRMVHFQKNTDEPLGITLKVNEQKKCIVSRILDGGMIHRQGTLHVGDEICEINGRKVEGETVEMLQKLLRECRGNVAFKILPSCRNQPLHSEMFVKALFSYDPTVDTFIPSKDAGLKFNVGDILRVVSRDDANWWQARLWDAPSNQPAKLIPSPQLQEVRISLEDQARKKNAQGSWLTKKKRGHKDKYLAKHNSLFDQLELVTYEEVTMLNSFKRRTLVLLGAHGVGRRHIKNMFITNHPEKFAYPIPHTTRQPRPDEEHGRNYFFVSYDQMTTEIKGNQFLEYGTHEGALYGTKLETIRQIHNQGLVAILDIEPQALKILRTAEYAPFVVFIAAPNNIALMNDASLERLAKESNMLERTYQHFFDMKIVNNEIDETIRELEMAIEQSSKGRQWIPVSWVY